MNKKISIKKTVVYIAVFVALVALTMVALLKDQDPGRLWEVVKGVSLPFLAGLIALAGSFVFFEGANIYRILRVLRYRASYFQCVRYAIIGYFFSAITPSASGGQPMQIYAMKKDGIQISHGSITLLIELLCFQLVTCLYGLGSLFMIYFRVFQVDNRVLFLAAIGIAVGVGMSVFLVFAIFSRKISALLVRFLIGVVERLPFLSRERKTRFEIAALEQFEEYGACGCVMKKNGKAFLKVFVTVGLQLGFQFAIAALAYLTLGQSGAFFGTLIMMQALVFLCTSFVPLPGAVGAAEAVFLTVFASVYASGLAGVAMILTRGVAFYVPVFLCGSFIAVYVVFSRIPAGRWRSI